MSDNFDREVIVIGGGPAGSTVAVHAALDGADVLVIDGRDPIGTPLQCGELVPTNDEMRRLCPDVPDMDDLFQTPKSGDFSPFKKEMHIVPPSGKPLKFDFDGYVLNRVAHDEFLVDLAKSAGADSLINSRVDMLEGNSVVLRNGDTYTAKVIVDAGGHNGVIRRDYWTEKSTKIPVKFVLMEGDFGDEVGAFILVPWHQRGICLDVP